MESLLVIIVEVMLVVPIAKASLFILRGPEANHWLILSMDYLFAIQVSAGTTILMLKVLSGMIDIIRGFNQGTKEGRRGERKVNYVKNREGRNDEKEQEGEK